MITDKPQTIRIISNILRLRPKYLSAVSLVIIIVIVICVIQYSVKFITYYVLRVVYLQNMNSNKRKGGAARLRDKNKILLLSLADSNKKLDSFFTTLSNKVSYPTSLYYPGSRTINLFIGCNKKFIYVSCKILYKSIAGYLVYLVLFSNVKLHLHQIYVKKCGNSLIIDGTTQGRIQSLNLGRGKIM